MGRLCDRYVFREFLWAFLIGLTTAVLLVVALRFQNMVTQFAQERAPMALILTQIAYDLPRVLEMALPVATALGSALATNRLTRDNEITVLRGTGTSLFRVFRPFLILGLLLTGAGLYISNVLQPRAALLERGLAGGNPDETVRAEGSLATRAGDRSEWLVQFASERIQGTRHTIEHLCLIESLPQRNLRVLLAPSATFESKTGQWVLQDVEESRYDAGGARVSATHHATRTQRIRADLTREFRLWDADQNTRFSFQDLTRNARAARDRGEKKAALELETGRWFKLTLPSMCFIFSFCAPPIVLRFSRAGSFAGVLLSIILVFVGWNTVLLMKALALSGWIPPLVCAFAPHVVFFLIGAMMLARSD